VARDCVYPCETVCGAGFSVHLPVGATCSTRYRWRDAGDDVICQIDDATTAGP
jgi:hypothetical protein